MQIISRVTKIKTNYANHFLVESTHFKLGSKVPTLSITEIEMQGGK